MHVLHLLDDAGFGGIENFVRCMTTDSDPANTHSVFIRASSRLPSGHFLPAYRGRDSAVIVHEMSNRGPVGHDVVALEDFTRRHGVDLLHANTDATHAMAAGLKLVRDLPLVRTVHAATFVENLVATLTAFSAVTDAVVLDAHALRKRLGTLADAYPVIHPGVDIIPDSVESRSLGPVVTIGLVAQFIPVKSHATLLNALECVRAKNWRLLLAGEGPGKEAVINFCRERWGERKFEILSLLPRVADIFPRIDIFVLPSQYEAYPLVTQEAMGFGIPVVASRVGGLPEQIDDGVNGLLFPVGDADALARCLDQCIAGGIYDALSRGARARAARDFRFSKTAAAYTTLFERIGSVRR